MITDHNLTELNAIVSQHFTIEEITYGTEKQPFVVHYRGDLKDSDSQIAFNHLEEALADQKLLPMIRKGKRQDRPFSGSKNGK